MEINESPQTYLSAPRLRVSRKLANREVLMGAVLGIVSMESSENIRLRPRMSLTVTMIDTGRRRLPPGITEQGIIPIRQKLRAEVASANQRLVVPVVGLDIFGNRTRPFVGLLLGYRELEQERQAMTESLQSLDALYTYDEKQFNPHLTLAQTNGAMEAEKVIERISDHIPLAVELHGPVIKFVESR